MYTLAFVAQYTPAFHKAYMDTHHPGGRVNWAPNPAGILEHLNGRTHTGLAGASYYFTNNAAWSRAWWAAKSAPPAVVKAEEEAKTAASSAAPKVKIGLAIAGVVGGFVALAWGVSRG